MKPLLLLLLLIFLTQPSFAVKNSIQLISKDYRLLSIDSPKEINSKGLFFPPNVIQFDKVNNLSYHLIDTNKIAIKEHVNGALIDIIEVPIKESEYESPRDVRPTITSLVLDTKRNQLWIITFQDFNLIFDLKTRSFKKLIIEDVHDMYGMEAGFYDSATDSTYIVYMGEEFPYLTQVSNNDLKLTNMHHYNLEKFKGVYEIYSIIKFGTELLVWEGSYNAEKLWTIDTIHTDSNRKINPINFQPPQTLTNKIDSRLWWGILPRAPYTKNITTGITKLTVNNISLCESFENEVTENYTSGKHLFDVYRQNVFGLNKFDLTKLTESPIQYTYEQEIDGLSYYITTRNLSGCGSRCNTEFTTITSDPLGNTWKFFDDNPSQPKPTPTGHHNLATDDSGQLFYVSFDTTHYNLHKFNKGKWALSCQVNIKPTGDLTNPNNKDNELKKELNNNLLQLSKSVHTMIGESGEGTTCSWAGKINYARKKNYDDLFRLVTSRPNQFTSTKNYTAISASLKHWSYGGLFEYQTHSDYQRLLNESLDQLSLYYQLQFNFQPDEAGTKAEYALKSAISAGINSFTNYTSDPIFELKKSILDKESLENIKSKITPAAHAQKESILNLAVDYPEALKLLINHKFDVNQQNEFGKTPLMYAAQQNQFESIKILLEAGANPNLMTYQPKDDGWCKYTLNTTNLSSLHYAVRLSDFKSIKSLINKGAWLELKALEGYYEYTSTALDWLAKHKEENQNLSKEDVKKLEILLIPKQGRELRRATKKLTIKAEKHYQDGQLDLAYKLLKLITSSDPEYIRALSDLALVALKIEKLETALTINQHILRLSEKDTEKASAYFNIGLTCGRIPEHNQISYSNLYMCHKGLLPNFVEALLLKQTTSRKNKVQELINGTEEFCTIENNNDLIASIHIESISSRSLISSYTKKNNKSINPINYVERLNLKKTVILKIPPSNYSELRKLNKEIVFTKKEVEMVSRKTYKDNDIYIEKVTFAEPISEDKIKELCQ